MLKSLLASTSLSLVLLFTATMESRAAVTTAGPEMLTASSVGQGAHGDAVILAWGGGDDDDDEDEDDEPDDEDDDDD